jgi:hypothetical protein
VIAERRPGEAKALAALDRVSYRRNGRGWEMNWRRGLLRLWLVLSLCWIVLVGVFVWQADILRITRIEACDEAESEWLKRIECADRLHEAPVGPADIAALGKKTALLALLPPSIALMLGLLGVWVVSGFARKGAG